MRRIRLVVRLVAPRADLQPYPIPLTLTLIPANPNRSVVFTTASFMDYHVVVRPGVDMFNVLRAWQAAPNPNPNPHRRSQIVLTLTLTLTQIEP